MGLKRDGSGDRVIYQVRSPSGRSVATFTSKKNAQAFVRLKKRGG